MGGPQGLTGVLPGVLTDPNPKTSMSLAFRFNRQRITKKKTEIKNKQDISTQQLASSPSHGKLHAKDSEEL